ncbi:MAG: hypothetical protein R6X02_12740 [Enhygromyxa sp.]
MQDDDDGNDDGKGKAKLDPDRAAILARRKQFIALALSGLATTAACTEGGDATPKDKRAEDKGETGDATKVEAEGSIKEEAPPQPCLSIAPPPEPDPPVPPEPPAGQEIGGETGGETGEAQASQPPPKPKPKPHPCLRKAAPKPCLKKSAPSDGSPFDG